MVRFLRVTFLVALAGCPKPGGGGSTPRPQGGVGCPAASGVYVASYLAPEEGGKGHTGWVLPLHDKVVDSLDGVADYAPIDAASAISAGAPAAPQNMWLMLASKDGVQPCKVTAGSYYAAAIDAPTKNIAYGVELSGCAAPQDPNDAIAVVLVSAEPPNQCQIVSPKPVAARVGETAKDGTWSRPTKETPIPAALAPVIPARECTAPACEKLWSIGQVDIAGKPVAWAGAVNWLATSNQPACTWKTETFSGFFVAGADGAPTKVTEGQDHPLALYAVLADGGGAKAVLATGPGEYTAYDLAGGQPTVGHHLVWLVPHPDSYAELDHLGPECTQ